MSQTFENKVKVTSSILERTDSGCERRNKI